MSARRTVAFLVGLSIGAGIALALTACDPVDRDALTDAPTCPAYPDDPYAGDVAS